MYSEFESVRWGLLDSIFLKIQIQFSAIQMQNTIGKKLCMPGNKKFFQSLLINSSVNTSNCCLRFQGSIHRGILDGSLESLTAISSIDGRVYQQTLQIFFFICTTN